MSHFPRILPWIVLLLCGPNLHAQEEAVAPEPQTEAAREASLQEPEPYMPPMGDGYFPPDWEPGTTELYYGASFHDRSASIPTLFVPVVDLGLVDFHAESMPRGGAEHLGALFFALEEELEPGFPMNLEWSEDAVECPALKPPTASAAGAGSGDAGSHPGCGAPARTDTSPRPQDVQ